MKIVRFIIYQKCIFLLTSPIKNLGTTTAGWVETFALDSGWGRDGFRLPCHDPPLICL